MKIHNILTLKLSTKEDILKNVTKQLMVPISIVWNKSTTDVSSYRQLFGKILQNLFLSV